MTVIFLRKHPSAKKRVAAPNYPHHTSKTQRRNEKKSEIVLLEKHGEIYEGTKRSLQEFSQIVIK